REVPPPPALQGWVKAFWSLQGTGSPDEWISQQATPDGCVEVIRRTQGRSRWAGEQPQSFAVGLIDAPTAFEISGDSAFAAVRLWPWAWSLLDDRPLRAIRNRWTAVTG